MFNEFAGSDYVVCQNKRCKDRQRCLSVRLYFKKLAMPDYDAVKQDLL